MNREDKEETLSEMVSEFERVKAEVEAAWEAQSVEQWGNIIRGCQSERVLKGFVHVICECLRKVSPVHHLTKAFTRLLQTLISNDNVNMDKQRKKVIVLVLLRAENASLKIVSTLASQSFDHAMIFLALSNQTLCNKMREGKVSGLSFTHTVLLACQILLSNNLKRDMCEEALRHLLIVDSIQQSQIVDMILSNTPLLNVICRIGSQQPISGYWHQLLAAFVHSRRIDLHEATSQQVNRLLVQQYRSIMNRVSQTEPLTKQINRLRRSTKTQEEKAFTMQQIRGVTSFFCAYLENSISHCAPQAKQILILEQLMGLKDFFIFGECVRVYAKMNQWTVLTLPVIQSIQGNCLPHQFQNSLQYVPETLFFLENSLQAETQVQVSERTSNAMQAVLDRILQLRFCNKKAHICDCFQTSIHSAIQRQYDSLFSPHQFLSSCHLMFRQISRVAQLKCSQGEVSNLRNYIVTNAKWLLNLSESCQAEDRRCINQQIITLILTYTPVMNGNEFLREVVENLVLKKPSPSQVFLKALSEDINEDQKKRLRDKIKTKLNSQKIDLKKRIELWHFVVHLGKDSQEFLTNLTAEDSSEQNLMAQIISCAQLGLSQLSRAFKSKSEPFLNKLRQYPILCEPWWHSLQ